jgi:hypothetical protein
VLARAVTHALVGLEPRRVDVEAHVRDGIPGFAIVGLADRACQEARERVRSGISAAELNFPEGRITVNLAPAELRKEGSGFDLPIALALLAASQQVPRAALERLLSRALQSSRSGISPRLSPASAASSSWSPSRQSRRTATARRRLQTSRTSAARNAPGAHSSWLRRAVTTSFSAGLPAPERRCSRDGCLGSCRRSAPMPRSR